MGVRLNKAVGYGFVDFEGADDPRIKNKEWFSDPYVYEEGVDSYREWFLTKKEEVLSCLETMGIWDREGAYDIYKEGVAKKHFWEYTPRIWEGRNIILWIPPSEKETFHRRDNTIDWVQTKIVGENIGNTVEDLWEKGTFGIPPYRKAIPRNSEVITNFHNIAHKIPEELRNAVVKKGLSEREYEKWKRRIGPEFQAHIWENWCPQIPEELLLYFTKCEVFSSEEVLKDLKPLYYQWWS